MRPSLLASTKRATNMVPSSKAQQTVENILRAVGADIPTEQRAQVGDAVDAAGVALLADDQDGHHRGQGLRDDREIDATHPALEQRGAENEGDNRRHGDDGDEREWEP